MPAIKEEGSRLAAIVAQARPSARELNAAYEEMTARHALLEQQGLLPQAKAIADAAINALAKAAAKVPRVIATILVGAGAGMAAKRVVEIHPWEEPRIGGSGLPLPPTPSIVPILVGLALVAVGVAIFLLRRRKGDRS